MVPAGAKALLWVPGQPFYKATGAMSLVVLILSLETK